MPSALIRKTSQWSLPRAERFRRRSAEGAIDASNNQIDQTQMRGRWTACAIGPYLPINAAKYGFHKGTPYVLCLGTDHDIHTEFQVPRTKNFLVGGVRGASPDRRALGAAAAFPIRKTRIGSINVGHFCFQCTTSLPLVYLPAPAGGESAWPIEHEKLLAQRSEQVTSKCALRETPSRRCTAARISCMVKEAHGSGPDAR